MKKSIKDLAKRNQTIARLYSKWSLLRRFTPPIKDFVKIRKINLILTVCPYTQLPYIRLSKLYEIATYLERKQINGGFVECGVCNGGSAGVVAKVAERNKDRHIWLFDSWKGMPEPSTVDISYKGEPGAKGMSFGLEEKVRVLLFKKLKLHNKTIHIVKGSFNDTIPLYKRDSIKIALLHLDCDWYESVKLCLEQLYDNVTKGGFIVIDDYGYWKGCKKAVDEFIEERKLKINLIKIDHTGVYLQKNNNFK